MTAGGVTPAHPGQGLSPVADGTLMIAMALLSVFACVGAFCLEAHIDFNLWDEGYLWYGVQRTLLGEVPIRDFMSYDPGRYYWAAALLWPLHTDGILAVRAATAVFSMLGVVAGALLVLRESVGSKVVRIGWCAFAIVMFLLWLVPWWKGYDAAISIILVASLAGPLARPSAARFFVHGVVIGLAAVLGRNHGLYGAIACLLVVPVLLFNRPKLLWHRCIPVWFGGLLAGYSPMLIGLVVDHRFAARFWEGIRFILFEYKGTNLPLPIPWPWVHHGSGESAFVVARELLIGSLFVALPAMCIGGVLIALRRARREGSVGNPVFVACVATGIPYLNVAFSRADVAHLAQAIFPFIIGLILCPVQGRARTMLRWVALPLLGIATLAATLPLHPRFQMQGHGPDAWQNIDVRGDRLLVSPSTATTIEDLQGLARLYVPAGRNIFAAPVWPGVFALLGARSAVWETYPLLPRSAVFQQQEIERLRRTDPAMLLVYDIAVDGRDELRYARTHTLMWQFIDANYRKVPSPASLPYLHAYIPKTK